MTERHHPFTAVCPCCLSPMSLHEGGRREKGEYHRETWFRWVCRCGGTLVFTRQDEVPSWELEERKSGKPPE